ncbi:unnamed protein product [Plutella xylostella]|nr:unnamed protein product [Plutella xylostella]
MMASMLPAAVEGARGGKGGGGGGWRAAAYECARCRRRYRHKSTYRRHVTYECGKEPMFRCPFLDCQYKAYQKTHTDAHVKTKHKLLTLDYK